MNDGRHGVILEIKNKNQESNGLVARHFPSGAIALPPFLACDLVVNSLRIQFLIKLAAVLPTKLPPPQLLCALAYFVYEFLHSLMHIIFHFLLWNE